jgi:hypothetical protein
MHSVVYLKEEENIQICFSIVDLGTFDPHGLYNSSPCELSVPEISFSFMSLAKEWARFKHLLLVVVLLNDKNT